MLSNDGFKTLSRGGKEWIWPAGDNKLALVFEHVADIDTILKHVEKRRVCVQAGGAAGVWPARFAEHFDSVYTFEPDPANYDCLMMNTRGQSNVHAQRAALGDKPGQVSIRRDPCHVDNYGAGYVVPGGNTPMITIDSLQLPEVDLIQLDVEGYEYEALQGAVKTLLRCKPVVVLEVKDHPQYAGKDYRAAGQFLKLQGYRETDRFHRDILYTC